MKDAESLEGSQSDRSPWRSCHRLAGQMDSVGKGELEFGDMKHGKDPRVTPDRAASAEVEARERFRAMFPGYRLGAAVIRVDDASAVQDLQEVVVAVTNNERMAALHVRVPVSHGDQAGADAVEYLNKRAKGQEDEYRYLLSQSPLQLPLPETPRLVGDEGMKNRHG